MNERQIEVHDYYKQQHPEALILYRLPGKYAILGEDVELALKSIPTIQITESGVDILPEDIDTILALQESGREVQVISYRNDKGILDFPDIKRLKEEKEMDY